VAIQQATLSAKNGNPSIEIFIGQAQHGTYRVYLWDHNGENPTLFATGTNWDQIPDRFDLGPVLALDQRIITWEILVSSAEGGAGQLYSVKVVISQKGAPVEGGVFTEAGPLAGSKLAYSGRRMVVV
jgi:hypothetical protein